MHSVLIPAVVVIRYGSNGEGRWLERYRLGRHFDGVLCVRHISETWNAELEFLVVWEDAAGAVMLRGSTEAG